MSISFGPASARAARASEQAKRRQLTRERLPRLGVSASSVVYVSQGFACFHCGGHAPLFSNNKPGCRASWDHATPKPERRNLGAEIAGAGVIAHDICNNDRRDRPLTPGEWSRAVEIWQRTARLWVAHTGSPHHPFGPWIAHGLVAQQSKKGEPS